MEALGLGAYRQDELFDRDATGPFVNSSASAIDQARRPHSKRDRSRWRAPVRASDPLLRPAARRLAPATVLDGGNAGAAFALPIARKPPGLSCWTTRAPNGSSLRAPSASGKRGAELRKQVARYLRYKPSQRRVVVPGSAAKRPYRDRLVRIMDGRSSGPALKCLDGRLGRTANRGRVFRFVQFDLDADVKVLSSLAQSWWLQAGPTGSS